MHNFLYRAQQNLWKQLRPKIQFQSGITGEKPTILKQINRIWDTF